jgi:hypothetical protein
MIRATRRFSSGLVYGLIRRAQYLHPGQRVQDQIRLAQHSGNSFLGFRQNLPRLDAANGRLAIFPSPNPLESSAPQEHETLDQPTDKNWHVQRRERPNSFEQSHRGTVMAE